MTRVLYYGWMILLACFVLVSTGSSSDCNIEEGEANIASSDCTIPSCLCPCPCQCPYSYSYSYTSLISNLDPRYITYNSDSASAHNELPSMQSDCEPLDLSCKTGARESSSHLGAAISTTSNTPTHACSSSAAKRIHKEAEKEDGEHNADKRQKTNTNTTAAMPSETNTALMDETEVRMAVEKFSRYFGKDIKVSIRLPSGITEFAEDLAQRGLASLHSSKIVELCMASEQWLGHNVFWRMLMFFVDRLSLEVVHLDRLEDKKTVVLRNRASKKPLSEYTKDSIYKTITKFRDAERIEMQCSLNVIESRSTADVLGVLRWLLHHVNIRCVGITCDLTKADMNSAVLERQMEALTKECRGTRVCIDSLALRFRLAQYKDAAVVVKECSWVTVLKIHFMGNDLTQADDSIRLLKALLLHCPALEQLSVFGPNIGIVHIRTIVPMLPQLVLLEIRVLSLVTLVLCLEEEKEAMPVFPGLKTLKLSNIYNYSCAGIEKFVELFPNLKAVQISAKNVATSLIYALSKLPHLRSLEIVNGLLPIETAEYLLEKLPTLEYLSVGVKELDNKLVHALSKYTGMQTLKLRGQYTTGFLASLLQPSPLMNTLKALTLCRNSGPSYRDNFSAEDKDSKKTAMENFRCVVETRY
ncbi:hypothetical protein NECID01_2117 [Nematocida sp. AWRm77]|nr:hypothetical protein NECID01_2117 [Nematocida sp. AWRm77]